MYGKQLRLQHIKNSKSDKFLFVTMDHGITYGVLPGLEDIGTLISDVGKGGADAVILHKGNVKNIVLTEQQNMIPFRHGLGLIIHLNASTDISPEPDIKIPVCTVPEAIQLGADAVSVHVNIGVEGDEEMIEFMGEVSSDCSDWGMPLIAMMYPRGPNIKSEYDPKAVSHCVRIGVELGADIIKTNYTGDIKSFKRICDDTPLPIIIAGGPQHKNIEQFYQMVSDAMEAGAKGVAIGRNIFGSDNSKVSTQIISNIVHMGLPVIQALKNRDKSTSM